MHDTAIPTAHRWRHIERYTYVQRPYEDVWNWLAGHLSTLGTPLPDGSRAVELRVRPGGHEVSRAVRLHVGGLVAGETRSLAALRWTDAASPQLFPQLEAELEIRPVPSSGAPYTQLGVLARYRPPFGALGAVGDRLIGAEVTDASLTTFLEDLAEAVTDHTTAPPGGAGDRVGRPADDPSVHRVLFAVDGLAIRPGGAIGLSDALEAVPGVTNLSVDPCTGLVVVDYRPEWCSPDDLAAVLQQGGA